MKKLATLVLLVAAPILLAACNNCCTPCDPCAPCCAPTSCFAPASTRTVGTTTTAAEPAARTARAAAPARSVALPKEAPSSIWDSILHKYVKGDYFDYAALKKNATDQARFKRFLDWQGKADLSRMSREDKIAFYINAYNSLNVKMVLANYPVHSPMDIPGFFDKIKHPVAGEQLTIAEAEYERLIAGYKDMRAHFAVVCSDRGCLPLKNAAYKGSSLDADLDAAARKFVNDERHFKVDKEKGVVHISKIFEWYGEKFTKDPKLPASKPELYLLNWVDSDTKAFLEAGNYEVKIIEWNWTINEQ